MNLLKIKISGIKYKALMNLTLHWEQKKLDRIHWHALTDDEIKSS